MEANEIRRRLLNFLGDDRFCKFLRAMPRSSEGTRLRYWQQDVWDAFVLLNPDCSPNYEELVGIFRICELHGEELVQYQVPVFNGCVDYTKEFWETRRQHFPNAALDRISTEGRAIEAVSGTMWVCNRCEEIRQQREEVRRSRRHRT